MLDLRSGAHNIEIDRGRQEKKPRAERICKTCNDGVEDGSCCHKMHGIPRTLQEKLKLSGLESEQFVDLFGEREDKKQWKAVGRFVVAIVGKNS